MTIEGTFVGIDVAAARPSDAVAIDGHLRIIDRWSASNAASAAARMAEVAPPVWVAVDSPTRANAGLMADPAYRRSLDPAPRDGKYLDCRRVEYELIRRGIAIYFAPRNLSGWMAVGAELFDRLAREGYEEFRGTPLPPGRVMLEYYPYASFCVLLGSRPAKKGTPAGREQRVNLIRQCGISGDLAVFNADQLDALAGAITAYALAAGTAAWVGDPSEGVLCVPRVLLDKYR